MEWLKKLLEAAVIKDGKVDVDALMTSVNTEFPKNAVPKDKFNDLSTQLKESNKTIEGLKTGNVDNEKLQNLIKEHESTIETLKTDAVRKEKESAIKSAFEKAGAVDPDYLIFKAGGIDKFELDKDGGIKDLESLVKSSKENNPTFFKADEGNDGNNKNIIANKIVNGQQTNQKDPGEMTMEEYSSWYNERNKNQ